MPADEELRGDVELLLRPRPGRPARGRHRRHQRRGPRHRARLDDQGAVPGPDPGVHRRRHRRVRRRDQGPRRHDVGVLRHRDRAAACWARPGAFDSIDVSAEPGVSPGRARRPAVARCIPQGTEAVTGAAVAAGERRRDQGELRDRRRSCSASFAGHRAVRRLVHHLEHLHDDRHPALAGDRAAAGDRCPPAPGAAQPADRGAASSAWSPRRSASGSGSRVAKGLKALMDAVGLALPFTSLQVRASAIWALAPGRHGRHRRRRPGAGPPGHQGAADRGAARVDAGCREALVAARASSAWPSSAAGAAGHAVGAVRRRRACKVFGLGLLAAMVGVHGRAAARGASAGRGDRGAAAAARHAGRAGQAERDAQPAPYLGHGRRADDRADPGREHGRVRLVAEGVVRRRASPTRPTPTCSSPPRAPRRRASARRSWTRSQAVRRAWTRSRPTAGARRASTARASSYSSVDPANAERRHEPRRLAGLGRRPRQGRRRGGEVGRDGARLEARRHRARRSSPRAAKHRLHVVGIYDGKGWIGDDFVLSVAEQNAFAGPQLVLDRPGHRSTPAPTRAQVQDAIAAALADHPDAKVLDQDGLREGGQRVHRPAADLRDRDAGCWPC